MARDSDLPQNTLDVFPVQFFSQRELPNAQRLRVSRAGGASGIWFGNSFPGRRRAAGGRTTGHRAIDIMAPRGVPIFAAKAGTVPATWGVFEEVRPEVYRLRQIPGRGTPADPPDNDGGNYIVVIDEAGRHHYYSHMSEAPRIGTGSHVSAGTLLGFVGDTGAARGTGTHLHYQVTTRRPGGGPLVFWNPYQNLVRLANRIGGRGSVRINISYDDFLHAVQSLDITPEIINPWDVGFPSVAPNWPRDTRSVEVIDPWR